MIITQELHSKIEQHLKKYDNPCPICNHNVKIVNRTMAGLVDSNMAVIFFIVVVCKQCGYIQLFSPEFMKESE